MPPVEVVFFQEEDGSVPVRDWISQIARRDKRIAVKCQEKIERLAVLGHELRRPEADLLRDGIYELRIRWSNVNYRILYFFHGRSAAILAHSLTKEREVPDKDIYLALERSHVFVQNPKAHSYAGAIASEDDQNENHD